MPEEVTDPAPRGVVKGAGAAHKAKRRRSDGGAPAPDQNAPLGAAGPLYCYCLRLLVFPRHAVPVPPHWLMTGKSPFSRTQPRLREIARRQEAGGLLTTLAQKT